MNLTFQVAHYLQYFRLQDWEREDFTCNSPAVYVKVLRLVNYYIKIPVKATDILLKNYNICFSMSIRSMTNSELRCMDCVSSIIADIYKFHGTDIN